MKRASFVHRCKFLGYKPRTIIAASFNTLANLLAVAREDGSIEIWNCAHKWFMERVIPGSSSAPVRSLAWSKLEEGKEQRLFGSSLNGTLFEVDYTKHLCITEAADSYGGAIWDLKASPIDPNKLVAACEDGKLRFFTATGGKIILESSVPCEAGRMLSLAWHRDGQVLFCGGDQSVIRKVSVPERKCSLSMTVEDFGADPTLVWTLQVLSDMTVVSGDSVGSVQIWDGVMGVMLQQFPLESGVDVVCMAVSPDEETLFAAGVDNRITMLRYVRDDASAAPKWTTAVRRALNSHDVRALAMTHDGTLVSAGVDSQLSVIRSGHFSTFRKHPIRYQGFRHDHVSLSPSKRLLSYFAACTLRVWKLGAAQGDLGKMEARQQALLEQDYELLVEINLKRGGNIRCAALSASGQWVACCNAEGIRLFSLEHDKKVKLKAIPVDLHYKKYNSQVLQLAFCPASRDLVATLSAGRVLIFDLESVSEIGGAKLRVDAQVSAPLTPLAVSPNRKWIAGGSQGEVLVFQYPTRDCGDQKMVKHHATVPKAAPAMTALCFNTKGDSLAATYADNSFVLYDVVAKAWSEWTTQYKAKLPQKLRRHPRPLVGISFDPKNLQTMFLFSAAYFVDVQLNQALPDAKRKNRRKEHKKTTTPAADASAAADASVGSKRKRKNRRKEHKKNKKAKGVEVAKKFDGATAVVKQKMLLRKEFSPLMFFGSLADSEIVVVEVPWSKAMKKMPLPFNKSRYGT